MYISLEKQANAMNEIKKYLFSESISHNKLSSDCGSNPDRMFDKLRYHARWMVLNDIYSEAARAKGNLGVFLDTEIQMYKQEVALRNEYAEANRFESACATDINCRVHGEFLGDLQDICLDAGLDQEEAKAIKSYAFSGGVKNDIIFEEEPERSDDMIEEDRER